MPAAYDTYDYFSYWEGRDYEHESELTALGAFLDKIPKIHRILEIGAGYGRLTPVYLHRAKYVTLSDPSAKLLKTARNKFKKEKKINYIQSKIENLPSKLKSNSFDSIVLVRVLHHIQDVDTAFWAIDKILCSGGYLILEFANKKHLKETFKQICKGNLTFPIDIFPTDKRSKKNVKKNTLPFVNYHPDQIKHLLATHNFEIIETRSVSNIRSPLIKKLFPKEILTSIETKTQVIFAKINFGPSIFILAKKK